jgi:hypothetical protein
VRDTDECSWLASYSEMAVSQMKIIEFIRPDKLVFVFV